jgi:hypothetical protein
MRTLKSVVAAILFAGMFTFAAPRHADGSVSVSVSFFHEELSPYGRWVVAGSYGDVWVPGGVTAGWSPYVDGEWVWTDYGWTWVAYDSWGDIPYHYGTWVLADSYGWAWVPGTVWAPAWVTWAYTDDYIGWAPVPPTFILSANGYYGRPIVVSEARYCFVPTSRFVGVNVSTVRVPVQQNATIFTRATKTTSFKVSGGIVHTAGPPPSRIEKVTGKHIERVSIEKVKARPTTISAAGITKGRSLHVAMPAKERAHALKAAEKRPATGRTEARAAEKADKSARSPKTAGAAAKHDKTHAAGQPRGATSTERSAKATKTTSAPAATHEKAHAAGRQGTNGKTRTKEKIERRPASAPVEKNTAASAPRTDARRHEVSQPQPKAVQKPPEKPHRVESPPPRKESHSAVNRVQPAEPQPPKERAASRQRESAPPPPQVASNHPSHKEAGSPPPSRVKNPPAKHEPKEEKKSPD